MDRPVLTLKFIGGPYDGVQWVLDSPEMPVEIKFTIMPGIRESEEKPNSFVLVGEYRTVTYVQTSPPSPLAKNFSAEYRVSPPAKYWDEESLPSG